MQNKHSTERLTLALLTVDDHEFIRSLVNTSGWIEFIGDRNVHSTDEAIAYINRIRNTPELFYWVVRVKKEDTPIGIISFLKRSYLEHFDIGFAFLPDYNGVGYAYEAAKEILSTVSKDPAYHTILATTIPRNVSSIKLLTKLGLHFEREIDLAQEKLHLYSSAASGTTTETNS